MDWRQEIQNPPAQYRPIPFLALNDKLERDELLWQIGEMKKAGLGGFFLHARSGLVTEYLSEEWMELTRLCMEESKRLGMHIWFYDENGYPSGFGSGVIPSKGVEYQKKWLTRKWLVSTEEIEAEWKSGRAIGFYETDDKMIEFRWVDVPEACVFSLETGNRILCIGWEEDPYYVDVLNKKVIEAFIELVHEAYRKEFQEAFGIDIKGIFTDEPQYSGPTIPWSLVLESEFAVRCGYQLIPLLPGLFYEVPGYAKLRHDYWKTVNQLFTEAYSAQIGQWCQKNNLIHTGHINCEEEISERMRNDAGAMSFYQHMHMPGVDWLARRIGTPVTVKQVSSVAHQMGLTRVICETYGGCGWNVSFEELKWISEWLYVLGVNATCQHMQLYSLRGQRKNDYPPSLFYQQPWWEEYRLFTDHFARLSLLLTQGEHRSEILILHPLRTAWIRYQYDKDDKGLSHMDSDFDQISRLFLEQHMDYDYGDEGMLEELGYVEGNKIHIGSCSYPIVILPSCVSLEEKTIEHLTHFAENGGKLFAMGELPAYCAGEELKEEQCRLHDWIQPIACDQVEVEKWVAPWVEEWVRIKDAGSNQGQVYCQRRQLNSKQDLLYLVHTGTKDSLSCRIQVNGIWSVEECYLDSGEIEEKESGFEGKTTILSCDFAPMQSHMYLLKRVPDSGEYPLSPQWSMELTDYNALVMDYASYAIGTEHYAKQTPIYEITQQLLRRRSSVPVSLCYEFDMQMKPEKCKELFLGIETPQQYQIIINGNKWMGEDSGWWRDKCIRKLPIKSMVQEGKNQIVLEFIYKCREETYEITNMEEIHSTLLNKLTIDMELCSLFLLGNFGVYSRSEFTKGERGAVFTNGPFYAAELPKEVTNTNLVEQGLCFYAGNVSLKQKLYLEKKPERITFTSNTRMNAVLYKLMWNQKLSRTIGWAPYETDLTGLAKEKVNELELILYGSCRNLFGPHHYILGEPIEVGPSSFTDQKGWVERFLTEEHIWTDRYCFVTFGLAEGIQVNV